MYSLKEGTMTINNHILCSPGRKIPSGQRQTLL